MIMDMKKPLKIYFAGSIRGGREDRDRYHSLIKHLSKLGKVLSEHIGNESLSASGEKEEADALIHRRDMEWLLAADAVVAEVSYNRAAQLGVSWVIDGSQDGNIVGLTKFSSALNVTDIGGAAFGDDQQIAQALDRIPDGATIGVGDFSGSTRWAAIVRALLGDASTNVLATPSIITLDNEEAELSVGQEVPFITGQFTNTGAAQAATLQNPQHGRRPQPKTTEAGGGRVAGAQRSGAPVLTMQGHRSAMPCHPNSHPLSSQMAVRPVKSWNSLTPIRNSRLTGHCRIRGDFFQLVGSDGRFC